VGDSERLLEAAEDILEILRSHRIDAVVIGAVALAAYNYVRQTEDIDLGVNANPAQLRALARLLESKGYAVELRSSDGADPLGGVIDVRGPFDALSASKMVVREGSPLKIVPLPHLIALKLYAGGHKSKADIVELLIRNSDADLESVKKLCRRYRLRGLDKLIAEAGL
jgi:hypothetical protein